MNPKQIHTTLFEAAQEAVSILTVEYPILQIGEELENLSNYFQGLAIANLLMGADVEKFKLSLTSSGYARRYFLRRSVREGNADDPRLALGRTEAFFDALAANQIALSQDIVRQSGETWHSDWEYEDDFCYFLFLHRLVAGNSSNEKGELRAILARFESALEGGSSSRLDVCGALLARDGEAFGAALSELMQQRREELLERRELMQQDEPLSCVIWARSFVSIEGYALMRIAELLGMPAIDRDSELPLCPQLGRIQDPPTVYEDIFEGIDRERTRSR